MKNVAVVETEIDAQSGASVGITPAEVRLVTAELRREAVKNLPRDKYNIMTTETVYAQGNAVLEECAEENCVIALGSKIGADYIVRGTISKLQTKFTLTVELYETENGNLVASSDPVRSENVGELLENTAAACAGMYKTIANIHNPSPKSPIKYTLTVNINPADGGTVSRSPDKETYAYGDTVNLTATPEHGYTFTGWTGATTNRRNQLTIMMNSDKTLTAAFYKRLYVEPKPVPQAKMSADNDELGTQTNNRDGQTYKAHAKHAAFSDAYVLPGVYVSHNFREGYRKFHDVDGYLHVENTNPFIFGLSVGKRVSINNPRLRFQGLIEFGRGSVKDGEYEISTNVGPMWASLYSVYWTSGILADAHLLFPLDDRTFFVSAGLGTHLTYFGTALKSLATGDDIEVGNDNLRGTLSPSANIGCGLEYKLDGRGAVCISYNMRFWQSANYKEVGMLFPMGVNYTEFFFSQSIQLQYLLPPRKKRD
jgi:uncharacterized repeat protein (TIGR02543 family)